MSTFEKIVKLWRWKSKLLIKKLGAGDMMPLIQINEWIPTTKDTGRAQISSHYSTDEVNISPKRWREAKPAREEEARRAISAWEQGK